jgi:hypothetical protein
MPSVVLVIPPVPIVSAAVTKNASHFHVPQFAQRTQHAFRRSFSLPYRRHIALASLSSHPTQYVNSVLRLSSSFTVASLTFSHP